MVWSVMGTGDIGPTGMAIMPPTAVSAAMSAVHTRRWIEKREAVSFMKTPRKLSMYGKTSEGESQTFGVERCGPKGKNTVQVARFNKPESGK
jgi:hypothetical protein